MTKALISSRVTRQTELRNLQVKSGCHSRVDPKLVVAISAVGKYLRLAHLILQSKKRQKGCVRVGYQISTSLPPSDLVCRVFKKYSIAQLDLTQGLESQLQSVQVKLGSKGRSLWLEPTRTEPITGYSLSLIHIWSCKNSPFPLLALWGNKNGLPSPQYGSEQVGKISEQNGLKGLQMVQFECPRHSIPSVSSILEVGRIPLSHY